MIFRAVSPKFKATSAKPKLSNTDILFPTWVTQKEILSSINKISKFILRRKTKLPDSKRSSSWLTRRCRKHPSFENFPSIIKKLNIILRIINRISLSIKRTFRPIEDLPHFPLTIKSSLDLGNDMCILNSIKLLTKQRCKNNKIYRISFMMMSFYLRFLRSQKGRRKLLKGMCLKKKKLFINLDWTLFRRSFNKELLQILGLQW